MKLTKFQLYITNKGKAGTMWVKESNPYYTHYRRTLKILSEREIDG